MEVSRRNVIDVSSFFFFEATGDSDQADTFNDPNVAGVDNHPDDDAESCSSDLSGDHFPLFVSGHHHHHGDVNGCDDFLNGCDSRPCSTVHDEEEEEEGDEVDSYSTWSCNNKKKKKKTKENKKKKKKKKNNGVERVKKSNECVDSSEQVLSEQEKNRLFWETCLAS